MCSESYIELKFAAADSSSAPEGRDTCLGRYKFLIGMAISTLIDVELPKCY